MSRRGFDGAMLSWLPGGTGTAALGVRSAMSSLRNPPEGLKRARSFRVSSIHGLASTAERKSWRGRQRQGCRFDG